MANSLRRIAIHVANKPKFLVPLTSFRQNSTDAKILTSVFKDIEIPNLTINEYVWQNLDRWPDKTLIVCSATRHGYTYAQTHRMSMSFAANLRTKLKLETNDNVAIILPNIPEYPCTVLGLMEAGCVPVLLNPVYPVDDFKRQLQLTNCKAVITSKLSYPNVSKALKELKSDMPVILVDNEDLPEKTIKFAEFAEDLSIDLNCLKSVRRSLKDTAIIPFSSGTSGFPKGVVLPHRSLVAMNEQIFDPNVIAVKEATATYQSAVPAVLPFFHIFGLSVVLLNLMGRGAKFVTMPAFKPELFLELIFKHRVEDMYLVPPIVNFLGKHPAVTPELIQSLRHIICGAAPLGKSDIELLLNKNKNLGFRQGYGMTETTGSMTVGEKSDANHAASGHMLGSSSAKIINPDTQEALGPGEEGEIWLKGPNLFTGYYKNEEATKEVFTEDGWFKTGDIGKFDEQKYIYITDRLKELIKVKGFQVAPAELETILRSHPKVNDCAVLGVPDPIDGEAPKAFLVTHPGHSLAPNEILDFVNSKVIAFKKIKEVQFVDEIPKNPSGKILRRILKQKYC